MISFLVLGMILLERAQGYLRSESQLHTLVPPQSDLRNNSIQCFDLAISYCADDFYTFRFEALGGCLQSHQADIETACAAPIFPTQTAVTLSCAVDIFLTCSENIRNMIETYMCLLENYPTLSTPCRSEFDSIVDIWLPCVQDADTHCHDEETMDDVLNCLSTVPAKDLTSRCQANLPSYLSCREEAKNPPSDGNSPPNKPPPNKPPPSNRPTDKAYDPRRSPVMLSASSSMVHGYHRALQQQQPQGPSQGPPSKDKTPPSPPSKKPCWDTTGTGGKGDATHGEGAAEGGAQDEQQPHGIPPPILIGLLLITVFIAWKLYKKPQLLTQCKEWMQTNVRDRIFLPATRPYRGYERTAMAEEGDSMLRGNEDSSSSSKAAQAGVEMTFSQLPPAAIEDDVDVIVVSVEEAKSG